MYRKITFLFFNWGTLHLSLNDLFFYGFVEGGQESQDMERITDAPRCVVVCDLVFWFVLTTHHTNCNIRPRNSNMFDIPYL